MEVTSDARHLRYECNKNKSTPFSISAKKTIFSPIIFVKNLVFLSIRHN